MSFTTPVRGETRYFSHPWYRARNIELKRRQKHGDRRMLDVRRRALLFVRFSFSRCLIRTEHGRRRRVDDDDGPFPRALARIHWARPVKSY